ncbi:ABC transporter ATP-binding protein [Paraoerskovia marina]|uniref:Putative ABC transport system ATP-binding protein n=1 Tax=Paraoerskovia marina TaxID=545619 RepID=A0A1H1QHT7_9CELL|nr:ABC transporter ATP-binding protein [Paraoerskovia marina]SDS22985.1 putative ABC transport system ATP-binding protein [Paraoerskovia marina]
MYEITDLTKTYAAQGRTVRALDGVSLRIGAGELVSVQGPTGGGKSTLLQMLGAMDRPSSGTVVLDGTDLTTASDRVLAEVRARTIGFVFQGFNLIPTLTAQENVETALVPARVPGAERAERARAALASVGLGDRGHHLPVELSGGQQQRVAIARALVKNPAVLLADEPTGNLDEETRDEIVELLEGLWHDGLTVVMVTHDSAVARRAERRLRIAGGTVSELTPAART